jgi:hypothetical protein
MIAWQSKQNKFVDNCRWSFSHGPQPAEKKTPSTLTITTTPIQTFKPE